MCYAHNTNYTSSALLVGLVRVLKKALRYLLQEISYLITSKYSYHHLIKANTRSVKEIRVLEDLNGCVCHA